MFIPLEIDLNTKDSFHKTGLHYACKNDNLDIVETIIQNSAKFKIELNVKDVFGQCKDLYNNL